MMKELLTPPPPLAISPLNVQYTACSTRPQKKKAHLFDVPLEKSCTVILLWYFP